MRNALVISPVFLVACMCGEGRAQQWYTGSAQSAVAAAAERPRAALDLALTGATQNAFSGTAIGTIAPFSPLDESGARLRVIGLLGSYSYISTAAGVGRVRGGQQDGSFLVGYEWVTKTTSIDVYVGADIDNNTLSKVDPNNSVTGVSAGAKIAADFYSNPTSYSMASGNVSYSTSGGAYYSRFKAGLAISEGVFAGPETLFLGDNHYTQYRVGLHLTGLRFGALQFGVSGGLVVDKAQGNGAYGIIDARVVF